VDPNSFFSDSDPQIFFSDSDPYTNILTRIFFKWCLSLLSFVFWNLYDREKSFPTEKRTFFVLQVFDLRFFTKFFYVTTVSGSESELFFGFGSSQNIRIISDWDPQFNAIRYIH
jgi:hypothetical protein